MKQELVDKLGEWIGVIIVIWVVVMVLVIASIYVFRWLF